MDLVRLKALPWYVLQSIPRAEYRVRFNLNGKFDTFIPEKLVVRQRHEVKMPLFPSFMFVSFEIREPYWYELFRTVGVRRLLLSESETPAMVQPAAMNTIFDLYGVPLVPASNPETTVQVGETAKVVAGGLAGMRGICTFSSKRRVELLLQFLGMARYIKFDPQVVESLGVLVDG